MYWKAKAAIQNSIARLPSSISYETYYRMQRLVGGLRRVDPVERLIAGVEIWRRIKQHGCEPEHKIFFEVGTGTTPDVPLTLWLLGANRTITLDVNPYLRGELVQETLQYFRTHVPEITAILGGYLVRERLDALLDFQRWPTFSLERFFELCRIQYIEPGDATDTGFADHSVDFHISYTVFEHIPPDVLFRILEEGNRITRRDGLFVHMVDYSDHFSHSDPGISAINFLQFSDSEWERYAGNRYMYMNRLRHDDMLTLFDAASLRVLAITPEVDLRASALLAADGIHLHTRFKTKSRDVLSIRSSWIVAKPSPTRDLSTPA